MREVEIKAAIPRARVSLFLDQLVKVGVVLGGPIHQNDQIFVPAPHQLFEISAADTPVARIRVQDDGINQITYLTLKRDVTDQLDSAEYEVVVSDAEAAAAILRELGLHRVLEISKTRRRARIAQYRLAVDDLASIGVFVELEASCNLNDDIGEVRGQMWQELERLGVSSEYRVTMGLDRIVEEHQRRGEKLRRLGPPDHGA